jgi:adenosylcobinamide kinase/adenosylcobinamide-phosphate guanylyltransferase
LEATDALTWCGEVGDDVLLLVDCLGTWLGRAMLDAWQEVGDTELTDASADALPPLVADRVTCLADEVVAWVLARRGDTIVVTNEVGSGIVPNHASGRLFRDLLGQANRALVKHADASYLCVAGGLIDLERLPRDARWPQD